MNRLEELNIMTAAANPLSNQSFVRLGHPQPKDHTLKQFRGVLTWAGAILEIDDAPFLFVSPIGVLCQEYEVELLFLRSLEEIDDWVFDGI